MEEKGIKEDFRRLNCGLNCKKNQIFRVNLDVNWKNWSLGDWNWTLKSLFGQIKGSIVKKIKLKFDRQLGVWLKKFKIKNQIVKAWDFKSWNWLNQRSN